MSILTVEHLSHGFGDRAIFQDVSFRMLKGEHIGLVGANGEEAVKKLKEDAVNGYHAGKDAISQSLFLFSKDRKELVVYEA